MEVYRPRSAKQACLLLERDPEAIPLAGGTDFMVGWNAGLVNGRRILDLSRITLWKRIQERESCLRIGALATHWHIQRGPSIRKRFPLLVQACATVGGRQIQTRGTLGGNIANASPAGDSFPPLAVYEAKVHVRGAHTRRTLRFEDVFAGVKRTSLLPGELIESIELPFPKRPTQQVFRKVGTRAASAISKVVMAALVWRRRNGQIAEARFAFGSMAPTVRRLKRVEELVSGKKPGKRLVDEAVALVGDELSPIDDLRSTRDYRLRVAQNLVRAVLENRGGH